MRIMLGKWRTGRSAAPSQQFSRPNNFEAPPQANPNVIGNVFKSFKIGWIQQKKNLNMWQSEGNENNDLRKELHCDSHWKMVERN